MNSGHGHFPLQSRWRTFPNDDGTDRQKILKRCYIGEPIRLIRCPIPEDENAVKVCRENGEQLGWVPRYLAREMTLALERGEPLSCLLYDLTGGQGGQSRGCVVKVNKLGPARLDGSDIFEIELPLLLEGTLTQEEFKALPADEISRRLNSALQEAVSAGRIRLPYSATDMELNINLDTGKISLLKVEPKYSPEPEDDWTPPPPKRPQSVGCLTLILSLLIVGCLLWLAM